MTPHFTLEELTHSDTAQARGIDNTPSDLAKSHLEVLAQGLELIRNYLGYPVHVNSGYRCPELNNLVHGVPTSAHVEGYAADFTCDKYGPPFVIVQHLVDSGIQFDQLIHEGTWVHVSFAPALRQQVVTAHFKAGKTTYETGVTVS